MLRKSRQRLANGLCCSTRARVIADGHIHSQRVIWESSPLGFDLHSYSGTRVMSTIVFGITNFWSVHASQIKVPGPANFH